MPNNRTFVDQPDNHEFVSAVAAANVSAGEWATLSKALHEKFDIVKSRIVTANRPLEILRPKSVDELISEEDFNRDGRLPYWADVWPSADVLAGRLAEERGDGRRLLELGCAIGYVACVAVQAGFHVTATDYYQAACDFTQLNAHRNGLTVPATRLVDWRDYPDELRDFDVVIASDVLYEKPYCDLVAACFARSLSPSGLGILTDPQRNLAAGFPDACHRHGLQITSKRGVPVVQDGMHKVIDLYELRRA